MPKGDDGRFVTRKSEDGKQKRVPLRPTKKAYPKVSP